MTTALSIKGLEKTYKGGFRALKGIDLDVQEGDFFALLGPNGAGKSTTISIITSPDRYPDLCRSNSVIKELKCVSSTSLME